MLERDGKLLLVQEGDAESYGKWNQPAGHLDPGETVFECALRETKEESGYDAELIALQAVYFFAIGGEHIVNVCFRAQPVGEPDAFVPGEILATRWFSREELAHLPQDQLRHRLTERRIRDWLRGVSNPLETIAHL
jgi:8-oxo-dGTP pyrophosphatase MutT (NUDIX family)